MQKNKLFFELLKNKIVNQKNFLKKNKQISSISFNNLKLARKFYNSLPADLNIKIAFVHGSTAKGTAGTSLSCIRKIYYIKTKFVAYEFYLDKTKKSDIDIIFIMDEMKEDKIDTIKLALKNLFKNVPVTLNIIDFKEANKVISDSSNPQALRRVILFNPVICLYGKKEFNKLKYLARVNKTNIDKQYEIEYRTMKTIPELMKKYHMDKIIFSAEEFKKIFPLLHDECCGKIYGDFPIYRIKIKIPPIEQKEIVRLSKINKF